MRGLLAFLLFSIGCSTATTATRTDELLRRYEMYGFSGSVLVAEEGRVALERTYGVTERAFDVGSIMKTVVAAAVLELQNDGKLRVTDPIGQYIAPLPPDRAAITIHQLLLHNSGLPLDVQGNDLLNTVATAPLGKATYSYSNAGYGLLALLVERVSGQPFARFARERLLTPAGMGETAFWGEPSLPMPVPFTGSSDEELTPAEPLAPTGDRVWNGKYVFGAAGMITTTGDLHRWFRFLDARPGTFTEHVEGQAYGWNVRRQADGSLRHYRGGLVRGSFMSMLSAYRNNDAVLIWMMNKNSGWHEPLTRSFERIVAGEPYVLPPAVVRGADEVASEYRSDDARLTITREGDDLLVAAEGQPALSLVWAFENDARAAERNAAVAKDNPAYEVLGTGGHASSAEYLQTFVRHNGEILRVISDGRKVRATGRGYPRGAQRRFRRTGPGTYALYDPRRDAVVTLALANGRAILRFGNKTASFLASI